jgi:hypothetical protein
MKLVLRVVVIGKMWMAVCWDVAPCSLVETDRCSRGFAVFIVRLWWWRQQAPLKRRSIFKILRGAKFQKTAILRNWNVTGTNVRGYH